MSIEAGVRFLFVKAPVYKGFPIPFNDNRLYSDSEMVTVEPFPFFPAIPFNERSVGCAFLSQGVCTFQLFLQFLLLQIKNASSVTMNYNNFSRYRAVLLIFP